MILLLNLKFGELPYTTNKILLIYFINFLNLLYFRDTAGQERYHSLAPMYYRGAQAAIVVYDIQNSDSFVRAKNWVKELHRQASPNIVIALAGNKADLANNRVVDYEEAKQYAEENGLLFMETSAKTAVNVNDIFLAIGKFKYFFMTHIYSIQ